MLSITASNGRTYEITEFKKNGDILKLTFKNEAGEELVYWVRITPKGKLVMN